MKICPKCQKTYSDDNLNFCLDDGAVLSQSASPPQEDKLPETVMMGTPRPTNPNQPVNNPPVNNPPPPTWGHQQQSQPNWGATPNYQTPANQVQKSSKSWIWVVGILAVVVFVCGGGLVGLIAFMASTSSSTTVTANSPTTDNNSKTPEKPSNSFSKIDLSEWTKTNPEYATSEYKDGEFILGTKEKGYYYVLVARINYKTENATTRVSVRNVEEKPSRLGYGLIFHSNPTPLKQDYGFLIDADKQRYRVVKHTPGKETDVIKWTKSNIIKKGTQKNVLEVVDKNGEFTLYINGQKIETMKNSDGYEDGVPGIYSGDGIPIAFSDLEVGK